MPTPVYAKGPTVGASDCSRIVSAIIASQCASQNNCHGKQLSDIRPNVIVELSRIPGKNFATACAGYVDSEFNNYMRNIANRPQATEFPTATGPSANAIATQNNGVNIPALNPKPTPEWKTEAANRAKELAELQAQNADAMDNTITETDFPTTINEVPFMTRMQNAAVGYAPYKDAKVYNGIELEPLEKTQARALERLKWQQELECAKNPDKCDTLTNTSPTSIDENLMAEIVKALKDAQK